MLFFTFEFVPNLTMNSSKEPTSYGRAAVNRDPALCTCDLTHVQMGGGRAGLVSRGEASCPSLAGGWSFHSGGRGLVAGRRGEIRVECREVGLTEHHFHQVRPVSWSGPHPTVPSTPTTTAAVCSPASRATPSCPMETPWMQGDGRASYSELHCTGQVHISCGKAQLHRSGLTADKGSSSLEEFIMCLTGLQTMKYTKK